MSFEVTILGNSSASPTPTRHPSGQYLHLMDHHILIDCGEGTQMQLQRYRIKKARITQVFISHVHGDHILGLPGLLLSMNLMRRTQPIDIFGPAPLFEILDVIFKNSETQFNYELNYHPVDPDQTGVIYENMYYKVIAFPLFHRVPTTGFVFKEGNKMRKLNAEACRKHMIPFTSFSQIKAGSDYQAPDGSVIPNSELTFPPGEPTSYAYCSDTIYDERVIAPVSGADILYHEATFLHEKADRAVETMHTTSRQAGMVAKAANAKKLLIGHFSARYEDLTPLLTEAREEFENTEIAEEGKTFIIE